jgi:putative spermidine/putrescine transport system permease protein
MFSLRVAILATLSAGGLGVALAAGLVWIEQKRGIHTSYKWYRLMQWPLSVPHLAGAYMMVLLLAQSGWLARWSYALGWINRIDQFPVLVNDPFGWGIIVTYTWKETPFITLMLYPVLRRIRQKWWDVARMHGAGTQAFIREVVLPLLRPAWLAASFIVFAFTLSAFEVPYLLGVTYPQALPVFSYELYTNGNFSDRPEALAANVILALITFVLGGIGYGLSRRYSKEGGKW